MEDLSKYSVAKGKTELTTVSHVTHIDAAVQILKDKKIKKHFINDESILTKKLEAVWVSPNDWSPGYRYGCIRFSFDFSKIIKGKRVYYVEIMEYGIHAIRLLITNKDRFYEDYDNEIYSLKSPYLELTQIEIENNPDTFLMYDSTQDKYYWNGVYTLELILDTDLEITEDVKIDFVEHHEKYCSLTKNIDKCNEKHKENVAYRFLLKLFLDEVPLIAFNFISNKDNTLLKYIKKIFDMFEGKMISSGCVEKKDEVSKDLINIILDEYYKKNSNTAFRILNLYKSYDVFCDLLYRKIKLCFYSYNILDFVFAGMPLYYKPPKKGYIYIFAKYSIKQDRITSNNHLFFISHCDKLNNTIYEDCGDANCILLLPEDDKDERERIIDEIINSNKYKKLVKI